jgi:tRNA threonylcarbamoyladenosine biosynthesis protein TsaB
MACREVLAIVDARMGEIYWGHYRLGGKQTMELIGAELLCNPSSVPQLIESITEPADAVFAVGSGCMYQNEISTANCLISNWAPGVAATAKEIIQLALVSYENGTVYSAEEAIPVYLRETVNWQKLPGR